MKWYTSLLIGGLALSLYTIPKTQKPYEQPIYNSENAVYQAELVDTDGDGIRDLVYMNGKGQVSIQKGFGLGRFGPPSEKCPEHGKSKFHVEDFDRDGDPDIVVTNWQGKRLIIVNESHRLDNYTGVEPEKYGVMYFGGIPVAIPLKK